MSGWVCPECRSGQHAHDRYPDGSDAGCPRSPDTVIECACDVVVHEGVDWRKRAEAAEAERDAALERMAKARRDVLTEAADDWQWGGWSDALMGRNIQERLRNAQIVTDWLRERAAREAPDA